MNPNRLTREVRKLPGNIRSPRLPGGTLISAVLDRQLMGWSDRGGASRIFGDIWSEHCWHFLSNGAEIFQDQDYDHEQSSIIRLDDIPEIAIQAGRNKLPNPDFLIVSPGSRGTITVRAVDAKFAVDRLKRIQISPDSIRELIQLPGSLARRAIERQIGTEVVDQIEYRPGLFLGPRSLLNDYFYEQITGGDDPRIPSDEVELVDVESNSLFQRVEDHSVMEMMKHIDQLEASSSSGELVLDMYYLRLASAARWFTSQARMPLLSRETPEPVEVDLVVETTEARIQPGESAYGLVEQWSVVTDQVLERQKRVKDAARLPVKMSEIRKLLEGADVAPENKVVRKTRGILERTFMDRLIDETGTIPPVSDREIERVISMVQEVSRSLREEMRSEARRIVDDIIVPETSHDQDTSD
jgi:hypothetical protein